ncbi:MAG: hotdog domain-containing protein [Pseudonocardiaceae bacterium]
MTPFSQLSGIFRVTRRLFSGLLDVSVLLRNLSMSFLNAPMPGILAARVDLLKLGKRLAEVRADVVDKSQHIVSAATLTFSIR